MKLQSYLFISTLATFILWSCSPANRLPEDLIDTYYGFLPCADCPGISYILELKSDGQYNLSMDYYDRDAIFESEGEYVYEDDKLYLFSDGSVTSQFEFEGDNLIALDGEGNRINTNLASLYILYKGDSTKSEMPEQMKTNLNQPLYKGTGNEPFWMVQVKKNTLHFKGLMDKEREFETPITSTMLSKDGNSIIYTGKSDSQDLTVRITHSRCQDNMSGIYFPTTLYVEVQTTDMDRQKLNGCGGFIGQYRLNGNWTLNTIDGQKPASMPTLSIYLPDGKISGSAGCNRYFGSIDSVTDTMIRFNEAGATKIACPDMSIERQYMDLLTKQDITWTIGADDLLTLNSSAGTFVFSRSDESQ